MNGIENFYHNQSILNTATSQELQQKNVEAYKTRGVLVEARVAEDTVTISQEAQDRLKVDKLRSILQNARAKAGDRVYAKATDHSKGDVVDRLREANKNEITDHVKDRVLDHPDDSIRDRIKDAALTPEELFEKFDLNGNGTITIREFDNVLQQQDITAEKHRELVEWFSQAEFEADGVAGITKQEAKRLYNVAKGGPDAAFHFYDANSDGKVTERELTDMVERNGGNLEHLMGIFKDMDANGNGEVTLKEFRDAIEAHKLRENFAEIFDKFDLDDDGTVTLREFSSVLKEMDISDRKKEELIKWFEGAQLEADGEEGMTMQEAKRLYMVANSKGADKSFHYYDANSDGVITEQELTEMTERNGGNLDRLLSFMELMDENGNGELTLAELHEFIDENRAENERLQKLFGEYDLNDDGKVTLREFKSVLDEKNISADRKEELLKWFASVEAEADGEFGLTLQETHRLLKVAQGGDDAHFYYYDSNSDGVVTKREVIDMVRRNGDIHDLKRLLALFEEIDASGNNRINLAEYHDYLDSLPPPPVVADIEPSDVTAVADVSSEAVAEDATDQV